MRHGYRSRLVNRTISACVAAVCTSAISAPAHADGLQTLYSFTGGADVLRPPACERVHADDLCSPVGRW